MSPKSLTPRHSIDSCMFQLHTWKPFTNSKTLDSDSYLNSNPNSNPNKVSSGGGLQTKRPCLSDRATSLFSLSIDNIDFSKLSLFDDGGDNKSHRHQKRDRFRWIARKRRRRGSRSVSGRSSDRSGTRNGRCCSVGATATCSDFMVAAGGTDSSGELFGNGNGNGWASDVSEARRERERGERGSGNGSGEREGSISGFGFGFDALGNESGYGSEPGYRGDAEFGYGDEVDDEEEDARVLLWGDGFGDTNMEMVGENTFLEQKSHHRGRRKKHDWRMIDSQR